MGNNLVERCCRGAIALAVLFALALSLSMTPTASYKAKVQTSCQHFKESGRTICGKFLGYWLKTGGLAQQGYPISSEMLEESDTDGKTYVVQYFERAVFERHPENNPPDDVLLQLLGVFAYAQKYPDGAPGQVANTSAGSQLFGATGKRAGGRFLEYWQAHGGLTQQGYPISDEFEEKSPLDGKTYKVQYFERAALEYHPENEAPYDVLLSQLGTFRYNDRYGAGSPRTPVPILTEGE
ncbi:MAG: hypothetical protein WCD37_15170 [Chloroflexia bacterium]